MEETVDEPERGPLRRCLVTGERLPKERLVRFVLGPDRDLVADLGARLPGRGLWVTARRSDLEEAVRKRLFSRAARAEVRVPDGLADRVEAQLAERLLGALGLARRAGGLICGAEPVLALLDGEAAAALVEASDGGRDGRDKILRRAGGHGRPLVIGCFTGGELGLALGRENMVHAALRRARTAERVLAEAERLAGFRPLCPPDWGLTPG
ncbi:MAG: RNA-binding protein [Alphaproteobacteria bacterium]|nr:RNA-binding protein [Alphaproteobacteria bacterium]